jgi:hypothetical protein
LICPLDGELLAARDALEAAPPETMPVARAAASELAMRTAAALVAAQGSRAILVGEHAQRLAREALFLLVFLPAGLRLQAGHQGEPVQAPERSLALKRAS